MGRAIRRLAALPVLLLTTALTVGCDGDDLTSARDAVIGDFTATEAVFTETADDTNRFDVIAEQGTFDIAFQRDGNFTSTLVLPDRSPVVRTGTFDVQGSNLVLNEGGTTRSVPFQRTAAGLSFVDTGTTFDFTGAGTPDPATLSVNLRKL